MLKYKCKFILYQFISSNSIAFNCIYLTLFS